MAERVFLSAAFVVTVGLFLFAGCGKQAEEHAAHDHPAAKTDKNTATEGVAGEKEVAAANTVCPVMEGNPVKKDLYVDHEGKRVYFCCKGCIAAFKDDPAKYMNKLK